MTTYVLPPRLLDYSLLDSGNGRKLERFGGVVLIRPEERASWDTKSPPAAWKRASAEFVEGRGWIRREDVIGPDVWQMQYRDVRFTCELGNSRQVGLFPENAIQWEWISEVVQRLPPGARVLNLFGYTGIATLVAAAGGTYVTHVDSSRRALRMGKANQSLSGLGQANIRWLQDDALKFAEREARRGHTYSGLILDPPLYGKGPRNETWQLERDIARLCEACRQLLEPTSSFVVMTAYALNRPPTHLERWVAAITDRARGGAEFGELAIAHEDGERLLKIAVSGRWASAS